MSNPLSKSLTEKNMNSVLKLKNDSIKRYFMPVSKQTVMKQDGKSGQIIGSKSVEENKKRKCSGSKEDENRRKVLKMDGVSDVEDEDKEVTFKITSKENVLVTPDTAVSSIKRLSLPVLSVIVEPLKDTILAMSMEDFREHKDNEEYESKISDTSYYEKMSGKKSKDASFSCNDASPLIKCSSSITRKPNKKSKSLKTKDSLRKNQVEELQEYEVEEILDYAYCSSQKKGMYRVKWVGWEEEFNTWEPYSNLHCEEKLKEFYLRRLKEREMATPARKQFLEVPPDPRTNFEKRSEFLDSFFSPPCFSELEEFYKKLRQSKKRTTGWSDEFLSKMVLSMSKKEPSEKRLDILREQLMLKHVRDTRKSQQIRLKEWENEINQMETVKITVENDADLNGPPRHMTYITKYQPSGDIVIPEDPPYGCECDPCELKREDSCCPHNNGHLFPYTKYQKLRLDVGNPIYECNKRCKCGPSCVNRVVQNGRKVKLCIFRTDNGCGWGVKTLENIRRGTFIVEYVGEVITNEEAEERGKKYDAEGRTYLFDLDFNLGDECPYTVDAANFGNVSHFINHSCDPNLAIFNVWIDCLDPNLPRLCLFSQRDILKGEQLTFDYCQNTGNNNKNYTDVKDSETINRAECKCGTKNCRKWLFER